MEQACLHELRSTLVYRSCNTTRPEATDRWTNHRRDHLPLLYDQTITGELYAEHAGTVAFWVHSPMLGECGDA